MTIHLDGVDADLGRGALACLLQTCRECIVARSTAVPFPRAVPCRSPSSPREISQNVNAEVSECHPSLHYAIWHCTELQLNAEQTMASHSGIDICSQAAEASDRSELIRAGAISRELKRCIPPVRTCQVHRSAQMVDVRSNRFSRALSVRHRPSPLNVSGRRSTDEARRGTRGGSYATTACGHVEMPDCLAALVLRDTPARVILS